MADFTYDRLAVSKFLTEQFRAKGLKVAAVAAQVGMSPTTLSGLKSGNYASVPKDSKLELLATAMGLPRRKLVDVAYERKRKAKVVPTPVPDPIVAIDEVIAEAEVTIGAEIAADVERSEWLEDQASRRTGLALPPSAVAHVVPTYYGTMEELFKKLEQRDRLNAEILALELQLKGEL